MRRLKMVVSLAGLIILLSHPQVKADIRTTDSNPPPSTPTPQCVPGVIITVAGNGTLGYLGDGGAATSAELNQPSGVAVDRVNGNIFFADSVNDRIRKVDAKGIITTVAGNGTLGYSGDGDSAKNAGLNQPQDIVVDASGNIFFADMYNNRIRKVDVKGIITTVAGNGTLEYSGDEGLAINAGLGQPSGIAVDASGNIFFADSQNHRIRKVDAEKGFITTVAGKGTPGDSGDGSSATSAELNQPSGVAVDGRGNIFIADSQNHRIRKVDVNGIITEKGIITTVAGDGTLGYSGDGSAATNAKINQPSGIVVDGNGNIFFADSQNHRIRKIDVNGIITTVAGDGTLGYSGDGSAATSAKLTQPSRIAVDENGNIFFADSQNHRIRKISACPPTHLACQNNQCKPIVGGGPDQCKEDTNCVHLTCQNNQCQLASGPGPNTCKSKKDCAPARPPTHAACNLQNQCTRVPGAGANLCMVDQDCSSVCEDSDGGNKPDVPGMVTVKANGKLQKYPDQCFMKWGVQNLREYFCENGKMRSRDYPCACSNGKCLGQQRK